MSILKRGLIWGMHFFSISPQGCNIATWKWEPVSKHKRCIANLVSHLWQLVRMSEHVHSWDLKKLTSAESTIGPEIQFNLEENNPKQSKWN